MTPDLDARLRRADPCPPGLAYADDTVDRRIRAIVEADTEADVGTARDDGSTAGRLHQRAPDVDRLELGPAPRSRRGRRWAVAAVAAVILAGGVVTGVVVAADHGATSPTDPVAGPWVRYDDAESLMTFDHPASWIEYHRTFQPTIGFLDVWLSTVPFPDPCSSSSAADGTVTAGCTAATPDLRAGGVFVTWSHGNTYSTTDLVPDPNGQVGGYLARTDRDGDPAAVCPGQGAVADVSVVVAYPSSSDTTRMTACVGPGDVTGALAAVDRMLASVAFR